MGSSLRKPLLLHPHLPKRICTLILISVPSLPVSLSFTVLMYSHSHLLRQGVICSSKIKEWGERERVRPALITIIRSHEQVFRILQVTWSSTIGGLIGLMWRIQGTLLLCCVAVMTISIECVCGPFFFLCFCQECIIMFGFLFEVWSAVLFEIAWSMDAMGLVEFQLPNSQLLQADENKSWIGM